MRRLRPIMVALGGVVALASFASVAWAYLSSTGAGSAAASTSSLASPGAVSGTSSGGTVTVSWTGQPAPDGGPVTGYYVQRSSGTPGGTCASSPASLLSASPTTCTDTAMPSGNYTYTVVAVFRSWTAIATGSPVSVNATDHFQLSAPAAATAGGAFTMTVTAQNAWNATDTGYVGTVHFSSNDSRAILPNEYTFVPSDAGTHTFSGTMLKTTGSRTVTVNDVDITTRTGSTSVVVNAAAPARLVFAQQPTSTTAGDAIVPAPSVRIEDEFGNLTTSTAGVTLTVTGATATLNGTTTRAGAAGVASYPGLTVTKAGTHALTATATGLTGVTSASFTITPAAATRLVFAQQPTSATAGAAIVPAPSVRIEDEFGNLTTSTAGVTLAVTGATATLNGTTTQAGAAGMATYPGLTVTKAGTHTLSATATGLTGATSASFTITPAAATKLCVVATLPVCTGGTINVAKGSTTTTQIRILDQFDNVATATAEITVTLSRTGSLGAPVPTTVRIPAGQGTSGDFAVTIDSGSNKSGTVTATTPGLTTANFILQS